MDNFTFRNDYEPPAVSHTKPYTHDETPPDVYDFNFNGGPVSILSSSKVTLVPFLPAWHAPHFAHHLEGDEDLVKWMPYVPNPAHGVEAVLECYEKYLRAMQVRRFSATSLFTSDRLAGPRRVPSSLPFSTLQARLPPSPSFQASCLFPTGIRPWGLSLVSWACSTRTESI